MSMKTLVTAVLTVLVVVSSGAAQTTPPPPIIQSVEARWNGVYVDLLELARSGPGELTVRYRYRNTGKSAMHFPPLRNMIAVTMVLDPEGGTVYGILKDADAKTVSSTTTNPGTNSGRSVAPGASQVHWAKLQAPPETVKRVAVILPGAVPMEDVEIGARGSAQPMTAPQPAIASMDAEAEGLTLEVVGLRRTSGGTANVIYRYRNGSGKPFSLGSGGEGCHRVYLLDPSSRKKHEVIKTKITQRDMNLLCGTTSNFEATWIGAKIEPGQTLTLWAKTTGPDESAKAVSLYVPGVPPIDNLVLAGTGTAGGGKAVTGTVAGLDVALKDLGAKVTEQEVRIALEADVLFDFDKADLKPEAQASLEKVATVLKAYPSAQVRVEGHTDAKGADAYNQKLSEQRAVAVAEWLASKAGLPRTQLATAGLGKTKPVAHNTKPDGSDDPEGRAKNRRVEIIVRK
jgi:outer membrane protein OmpA-like peptidoglycan-associated protein